MKGGLRAQKRLGAERWLDKTPPTARTKEQGMAADERNPEAGKMDFPVHERNYSGFIKLLKISTIVTAVVTALVLLIIAN